MASESQAAYEFILGGVLARDREADRTVSAEQRTLMSAFGVLYASDLDPSEWAGLKHAREVAASLEGVAATVTLLRCPTRKDVADYLAAGGTLDELVPLENSGRRGRWRREQQRCELERRGRGR